LAKALAGRELLRLNSANLDQTEVVSQYILK